MEKHRFGIGGMAVLLTVVLLCVSILAALTVVTALADEKTAQRYGAQVQQLYACENDGQRWLAELPENLPVGEVLETEITHERGVLQIAVEVTQEGCKILRWNYETRWQPAESWELWQ